MRLGEAKGVVGVPVIALQAHGKCSPVLSNMAAPRRDAVGVLAAEFRGKLEWLAEGANTHVARSHPEPRQFVALLTGRLDACKSPLSLVCLCRPPLSRTG